MLHGGNGGGWAPVMGKMKQVAASAKVQIIQHKECPKNS